MGTIFEFIRAHHCDILSDWKEAAQRSASARGLTGPEFANVMPEFLVALAQGGAELGQLSGLRRRQVESHFAARLRQGFNIAEIVDEFAILGRCISHTWAWEPVSEQPSSADTARLYQELHLASAAIVEMFGRHMLEDEQTEKRYLRLIQDVANEALHAPGPNYTARLQEVLALIIESTASQCAALLLYENEPQKLFTAVSWGVGAEALQRHALAVEATPGSAETVQPAIREENGLESRELVVSEDLTRQGIRSLLRVALPPRHKWLGHLFVGLSAGRSFAAREVRRLETLGAWLLLHLDNSELYRSLQDKVMALEEERALRERFVSILAHDLRGPLAAAKTLSHLLIRHPKTLDERRDLAIKLDKNLERTDSMVRDLLDANRIRAGERLPLRLDVCDLGAVAGDVVAELSALNGNRIVLTAEERVCGVWSAEELRRALWNLATNALKYGDPKRPVTVTVARAGDAAVAAVHNYGQMIAAEDRARLFQPFTRLLTANTGDAAGWGLGLALVRSCAEAHGGRIELESQAELGTTFTLRLPLDARPYQSQAVQAPGAPPSLVS
jgi:signal transduction histidine kinase